MSGGSVDRDGAEQPFRHALSVIEQALALCFCVLSAFSYDLRDASRPHLMGPKDTSRVMPSGTASKDRGNADMSP